MELLTSETKSKRPVAQESSQTVQVERERERETEVAHRPMVDEWRRDHPMVGGEQLLTWWTWMLRDPKDRDEENPIG